MKIFYSFLFIGLSLFSAKISAQAIDFDSVDLIIQEVIPVDNQGYVIFKADNADQPFVIEFSFFDENTALVSTHKMPVYKAGEICSVEKVFVWQGKLILHAAHYLSDTNKNQLFQYTFSLPNLSLLDKTLVLLSKAPDDVYVPYFSTVSPDKTKLVVAGWDYNKRKGKAYIRIRVVDEKLKEIRRQTYLLPYENRRLSIEEVLVNNNGEVYLTGHNYNGNLLNYVKIALKEHFTLGLLPEDKSKLWKVEKDRYIFQSFRHTIDSNGNLIGLGLCEKGGYQGSAFYTINPSIENVQINTQSIDKERFVKAFTKNTKYITPPKHPFKNYQLNRIVRQSDAYYLIAEYQSAYSLEDILVLKLDMTGDILWSSRIPKAQDITFMPNFFSYAFVKRKEKFYFLFNDNIRNYQTTELREIEPTVLPNVGLVTATVDLATGALKRRQLKNVISEDYIFLPNLCHSYAKEKALLMSIGIKLNAGKIKMKKIIIPE